MASLPKLITQPAITQALGAFTPLAQISSVVQTLQNVQGFNAGAFSQLSGSIQSALQGFDQASNILSNFSGNSPISAFTNALGASGLAGSSINEIAGVASSAFRQVDSFLSSVSVADSFAKLSSTRPDVEASRAMNNNTGATLQFPLDIGKYYMAIGFTKYFISANAPIKEKPQSTIILPVPTNLQDNNALEYSVFSLPTEAIDIGMSAVQSGLSAAAQAEGASKRAQMIAALTGQAARTTAKTFGSTLGTAFNTHQTLMFVQPTLKSHQFTWKLIPSSEQEAKIIYNIINSIKKHIYPKADLGFFTYPDHINVYLYNADQMYVFKRGFVDGFSVNYTPDGGPAFYKSSNGKGGYPVAVNITLSFKENAVWNSDDFTPGGYTMSSAFSNFMSHFTRNAEALMGNAGATSPL